METEEIQKTPEEKPETTGKEPQAPQQAVRIRGADGKFISAKPAEKPTKPAKKTTAPKRSRHPENIDLRQHLDKSAARKIKRILNPPEEEEPEETPELPEELPDEELPEELPDEEEEDEEQSEHKSQIFKTYGIIIGLIICGIAAGWVFLRHRSKKLAAGNTQPYYAEAQS